MTKVIGVLLIVLGLIGIGWGGFNYTTEKKIIDIGPIQATEKTEHHLPLPPVAGAVALLGGVALLVTGKTPS